MKRAKTQMVESGLPKKRCIKVSHDDVRGDDAVYVLHARIVYVYSYFRPNSKKIDLLNGGTTMCAVMTLCMF